jgi:hypothetical protein
LPISSESNLRRIAWLAALISAQGLYFPIFSPSAAVFLKS